MGAALKEADIACAEHSPAGAVVYSGHCYDRQLNRCRIYAVADGKGSMEWRIVRLDADGDERGLERCFHAYAEAMRWIE